MASTIAAGTTSGTAIAIAGDTSGVLQLQTNGTTAAVTIDTSQNVGIGTSSPTSGVKVDIVSADSSQSFVNVLKLKTTNTGDVHPAILFENNRNSVSNAFQISLNSGTTAGTSLLTFIAKDSGGTFNRVVDIENNGDFQFNSGYGSVATAYGCRAWVNFNGTTNVGGNCTIRGSGNVSSVADNGTGDYTVNLTTAMPDGNYSAVSSGGTGSNNIRMSSCSPVTTTSTSQIRVLGITVNAGSLIDLEVVSVAVFR
jgi:hypothetical protein